MTTKFKVGDRVEVIFEELPEDVDIVYKDVDGGVITRIAHLFKEGVTLYGISHGEDFLLYEEKELRLVAELLENI